jgi:hypothetical protein
MLLLTLLLRIRIIAMIIGRILQVCGSIWTSACRKDISYSRDFQLLLYILPTSPIPRDVSTFCGSIAILRAGGGCCFQADACSAPLSRREP